MHASRRHRSLSLAHRPSPIGYRLSPIGYPLSPIGYRLSAIGYRLSAIGYRLSAILLLLLSPARAADPPPSHTGEFLDLFSPALRQNKERRAQLTRELAEFQQP